MKTSSLKQKNEREKIVEDNKKSALCLHEVSRKDFSQDILLGFIVYRIGKWRHIPSHFIRFNFVSEKNLLILHNFVPSNDCRSR
jgi:hypothetical protein